MEAFQGSKSSSRKVRKCYRRFRGTTSPTTLRSRDLDNILTDSHRRLCAATSPSQSAGFWATHGGSETAVDCRIVSSLYAELAGIQRRLPAARRVNYSRRLDPVNPVQRRRTCAVAAAAEAGGWRCLKPIVVATCALTTSCRRSSDDCSTPRRRRDVDQRCAIILMT
jgi:hypothetical protein